MKKYRTVFKVSQRLSRSLLGIEVPACYVSVSTPCAPSFSTLVSRVVVGKTKGITVTASPALLFNELAIAANLLDDDGR